MMTRRAFVQSAALAGGAALAGPSFAEASEGKASPAPRAKIPLGFDNFAIRAFGWKADRLVEYAAEQKLDYAYLSDLDCHPSLEDAALRDLKKKADDLGVRIHVGSWSICPTSGTFKNKWGTAEEHLRTTLRVAKALGSPVARVVLGNAEDRKKPGGIEAQQAEVVKVCKAVKAEALDWGVKIAVENHAGDQQAWELVRLIEEAGKDYVGAAIDSGNATWALEDPLRHLEILGPYTVTSSLRDSAVWENADGAVVAWTAMGEGQVDWKAYVALWEKLCPGVPIHLELISGFNRPFPYFKPDFWNVWPKARAHDFARFVAMAKAGKPREPWKPPSGVDRKTADQEFQKGELERSLRFCRETLGLGTKS